MDIDWLTPAEVGTRWGIKRDGYRHYVQKVVSTVLSARIVYG